MQVKLQSQKQAMWERLSPQQSASKVTSNFKALSIAEAKIATFTRVPFLTQTIPTEVSIGNLFYKYCFSCNNLFQTANIWKQTLCAVCVMNIKKWNIMGLMKVQYNRFKLDCLWKGAIQQTETKQWKSILLSSCHLYVRVIGSIGKDRGGFKRQREESALGKR